MKTFLLILALMLNAAYGIPEKNYSENWNGQVLPYFSQGLQRTFVTESGVKLNYYSFVSSENHKTIVVLPGRTEPALKYAELVYDLKDLGYNFFILDHRGQGASDRLLKDSHKGYVKHFGDYTNDLKAWLNEVVIPETKDQERTLIAHSMGGAIGTLYLASHKDTFKKAVLSCPMFEVDTKPYKESIGRLLTGALVLVGQGSKYAPDRGPYVPENDTFEKNEVTHSEVRFDMNKYLFVTWPDIALGGPTNRWVNQSLKATKKIDSLASQVEIPVLMFQSGLDLIVKPGRQNSFCEKHSRCKLVRFPNGHHEILQESDGIRDVAISEIKAFLN